VTVQDCKAAWEWALISTDGNVRPCCYAGESVGNLAEQSFEEIWNGPGMASLRQDLLAGRVNRVCRDAACKYVQHTPVRMGGVVETGPLDRLRRFVRLWRRRIELKTRKLWRSA